MAKSNFIFTIGMVGLNLNDPNLRYFDVNMYAKVDGPMQTPLKSINMPL